MYMVPYCLTYNVWIWYFKIGVQQTQTADLQTGR